MSEKSVESIAVATLRESLAAVKDRHGTYGPPNEHFARTAGAISAVLAHKLREPLTAEDWAICMILDKCSRHQGDNPSPDNPIDIAGYAACLAEVAGNPSAAVAARVG
jgi:hypothetical protein